MRTVAPGTVSIVDPLSCCDCYCKPDMDVSDLMLKFLPSQLQVLITKEQQGRVRHRICTLTFMHTCPSGGHSCTNVGSQLS